MCADDKSIVARVLHNNWDSFNSPMFDHALRAPGDIRGATHFFEIFIAQLIYPMKGNVPISPVCSPDGGDIVASIPSMIKPIYEEMSNQEALCLDGRSLLDIGFRFRRAFYLHHSMVTKGLYQRLLTVILLLAAKRIFLPARHIYKDLHPLIGKKRLDSVAHLPFDWKLKNMSSQDQRSFETWQEKGGLKILFTGTTKAPLYNSLISETIQNLYLHANLSLALKPHFAAFSLSDDVPVLFRSCAAVPLIEAADLVITGYSSTALEAVLLGTSASRAD
ncbi:MAG: hypothetical protein GY820_36015 [Gammaproteobacteria bacterium]|nr:hypothetical protein [Gammaproteobacteria bacterium]